MNSFIKVLDLNKFYDDKEQRITVLKDVNFNLHSNQIVSLTGPSGSGKSTLLHILALLDTPDSGFYSLNNSQNLLIQDNEQKNIMRKKKISILFQNFNLINDLTTIENVMLSNLNLSNNVKESYDKAFSILKKIGLENRLNHFPTELSGGEKQRVALARCLINSPNLILADEPTGSLDNKNSEMIFDYLKSFLQQDRLIIFATHNRDFVNKSDLELTIRNGTVNYNE